MKMRTLLFGIDVELGGGDGRFTDAVVGDAFYDAVVAPTLDRFDAQHAAVRHVDHDVALTTGRDPASGLAPEHVRGRIARRLAEEADRTVVDDALVPGRKRYLRRICNAAANKHTDVLRLTFKRNEFSV